MNEQLKAAIKKAAEAEYELLLMLSELNALPDHGAHIDELIETTDDRVDELYEAL